MQFHNLFSAYDFEEPGIYDNSIVIMIDVLRTSTTVCSALFNGAASIIPCNSYEQAKYIYGEQKNKRLFILAGEENSVPPEGFTLGNSPLEYTIDVVKNKTIILATSNGTKIFEKAETAVHKVIGSFVNARTVLEFVESSMKFNVDKIITICGGSNREIAAEDVLCAGMYLDEISANFTTAEVSDAAKIAIDFFVANHDNIQNVVSQSKHAKTLRSKGFAKDIAFASTLNRCAVLPLIQEDLKIIKA